MGAYANAKAKASAYWDKITGKKKPVVEEKKGFMPIEPPTATPMKQGCCNKSCCKKCCIITTLALIVLIPCAPASSNSCVGSPRERASAPAPRNPVCCAAKRRAGYYALPYVPAFGADYVGSSSHNPIVIYCERTVTDTASYQTTWNAYSVPTQKNSPGVLAMFSFIQRVSPAPPPRIPPASVRTR